MSTLFVTLIIAFILVVLAIASLALGWLFSGKSKIKRGACGMDPTKNRKDECGKDVKCDMCEHPEDKETKEKPQ